MSKFFLAMVAYGAFSTAAFAQDCPPKWNIETRLEGTIGSSRVRVYFSVEPDGTVEGNYYDVNTWVSVGLEGTLDSSCQLGLKEIHGTGPDGTMPEGTWTATLSDGSTLTGQRTSSPSGSSGPIALQEATDIDCYGGRWVGYQKKGFPATFEYPDGWHLADSEKTIDIVCPDPAAMSVSPAGMSISIIDDVKNLTEYGRFTKYQDTWLFSAMGGDCQPPDAFCAQANVSTQDGMTVLHGLGTVTLYGPKGYLGIGEQDEYLLMAPSVWINVAGSIGSNTTNRIVSSIRVQR